uniref:Uncharacterized protein n=1 Tax=Rhizophora mucronata TaxID=61149 RepID=A0A2P2QJ72_RHIMU
MPIFMLFNIFEEQSEYQTKKKFTFTILQLTNWSKQLKIPPVTLQVQNFNYFHNSLKFFLF